MDADEDTIFVPGRDIISEGVITIGGNPDFQALLADISLGGTGDGALAACDVIKVGHIVFVTCMVRTLAFYYHGGKMGFFFCSFTCARPELRECIPQATLNYLCLLRFSFFLTTLLFCSPADCRDNSECEDRRYRGGLELNQLSPIHKCADLESIQEVGPVIAKWFGCCFSPTCSCSQCISRGV